jgi:hypothetical protein
MYPLLSKFVHSVQFPVILTDADLSSFLLF